MDSSNNDVKSYNEKKDQLAEDARKLAHEQKVVAKRAEVEQRKQALKEAQEGAEKAAANDHGPVSIPPPGREAIRTETLAKQAERDLATAEAELRELEKSDGSNDNVAQPDAAQSAPVNQQTANNSPKA